MGEVFNIISSEKSGGNEVFVNISGGTMEYAVAATMASMMLGDVELFSVGIPASYHTLSHHQLRKNMMHDGKMVGSGYNTTEPFKIPLMKVDPPDKKLLLSLYVFSKIPISDRKNTNVIRNIMRCKLWFDPIEYREGNKISGTSVDLEDEYGHIRDNSKRNRYLELQRSEAVRYSRKYITEWIKRDWIYKDKLITGNKYDVSDNGKIYLQSFYQIEMLELESFELILTSRSGRKK